MAHEIKPWKGEGLALTFKASELSNREEFSREIDEEYHEGGELNANFRTVEAVAIVVSTLADTLHFRYGEHYVWKTAGADEISFDFATPGIKERANKIILAALGVLGVSPID